MLNIRTRALSALVAAGAMVAMTACSSAVDGDATAPANAQPPVGHGSEVLPTIMLSPGIQIRSGEGDDARVCTLGWLVKASDGSLGALTAGQCAVGENATATTVYTDRDAAGNYSPAEPWTLGTMGSSLTLPYDPTKPNITIVSIDTKGPGANRPATPAPGADLNQRVIDAKVGGDLATWAEGKKGEWVCWYTETGDSTKTESVRTCGKLRGAVGTKAVVELAERELKAWKGSDVGAPAMWVPKEGGAGVALGVVTDQVNDTVIIDTIPSHIVSGAGLSILLNKPKTGN